MALHFFNQDVTPEEYLGWVADESLDPATLHPGITNLLVIQGDPLPIGVKPGSVKHLGGGTIEYELLSSTDDTQLQEFVNDGRKLVAVSLLSALLEAAIPVIDGNAALTPTQQGIVDRLKTDFAGWGGVSQGSDLDTAQLQEAVIQSVEAQIGAPTTGQIAGTIVP